MPLIFILILLIIIFNVLRIGIGSYFYNLALNRNTKGKTAVNPEADGKLPFELDQSFIENSEINNLYMQTFDELILHGITMENKNNQWVIVCHGFNNVAKDMSYMAEKFYKMGFSVLLPEARGHGESQGEYRGMGFHDRLDLKAWIEYLNDHYECEKIFLYGLSMGAATVMLTTGESLPNNVKGAIEDCGYSSIKKIFKHYLNNIYKLPTFPILNFANSVTKKRAGYSILRDGNVVKAVAKSQIPILFIHGDEDTFVPFEMLDEVYEAAKVNKEKLVVKGSAHALSSWDEPQVYWNTVELFIKKYMN